MEAECLFKQKKYAEAVRGLRAGERHLVARYFQALSLLHGAEALG